MSVRRVSLGALALLARTARLQAALAFVAGHGGSRCARKGRRGGGSERRAYSAASNIAHETEAKADGIAGRKQAGGVGWRSGRARTGKKPVRVRNRQLGLRCCQSATGPCQELRQTPRLVTRAKESSANASVWVEKTRERERVVKAIRREASVMGAAPSTVS